MCKKSLFSFVILISLTQLIFAVTVFASGEKVAVIAPSVSTSIEARSLLKKNGWIESGLREADFILVVVRSMLMSPLNFSYDCYKELLFDAEGQLNIVGANYCVYLYQIDDDDLSLLEIKHFHYEAGD